MITPDVMEEFKERMHITHNAEDGNLNRLLSFSTSYVKSKCGSFNISGDEEIDTRAKELVFERTRFAYNDALEYFEDSFLSDIHSLGFDIAVKEGENVAAAIQATENRYR